jgi:hypothetical protein
VHLFIVVLFAVTLEAVLGRYGASISPMATFSGFWYNPGHDPLGNLLCIAPAHLQGLPNGLQWRNILMPSTTLSLTIAVAKCHVLVIIN